MKSRKEIKKVLLLLLVLYSVNSYAYFDPGVGSLIGQFVIAGIATVSVYFRRISSFVKAYYFKLTKKKVTVDEVNNKSSESKSGSK